MGNWEVWWQEGARRDGLQGCSFVLKRVQGHRVLLWVGFYLEVGETL